MADKSIFELTLQTTFASNDRLVVGNYANSDAEAITGQMLVNLLAASLDGHGGIQSIEQTGSSGTNPVVDTYTITMADQSIATFTVTNGLKGDQGLQTFIYFRWAHTQPSAWSDTTDQPDEWMGVYAGTATSPPTTVSSYTWVKVRGDTGEPGAASAITGQSVSYMESTSGTIVPSGSWSPTVPSVTPGNFLWTRTQLTFNDGTTVTSYSVSRFGIDGAGSVSTVNSISPDQNGNITLYANNIAFFGDGRSIENHIESIDTKIGTDTLETSSSTIIGAINEVKESIDKQELYVDLTYNGVETNYYIDEVTSDYVVSQATVDDPSFQVSDWTLTTSNGYITISGLATEPTGLKLLLTKPTFTSIASYETEENPPAHSSGTSRGKVISILGDSISTYQGYIPEGHDTHYTPSNLESVNDTWWMKVINALGASLGINESWGNSRVTTTREGAPESMAACSIERTSNLGNPDIIIIWIGINDFNHEVDLGTYDGTGTFPTTTTTFREAYSIMLYRIMKNYPHADVYCCTLPPCEHNGTAVYPPEVNENGVTLNTFNNAIRDLSGMFGAQLLDIARAGITHENLQYYMQDWGATSKSGLHPNADGFSRVANYMIKHIDPACRVRYPFHTST